MPPSNQDASQASSEQHATRENEYANYAPGTLRNARALRHGVLAALIGLALGLYGLNTLVTTRLWRPYLGVQSKKLERLAQIAGSVDVLFLGSSHIENGVDPRAFDAAMLSRCGVRTSSFNAAIGDLRGPELSHYLEAIAKIDGLSPKFVFIEPLINPGPTLGRLFANRARYHFTWDAVRRGIQVRWQADLPLSRKLGSIGLQLLAASVHQLNLGVLSDVVLPNCPECERTDRERGPFEERPSRPYDRGYAAEAMDPRQLDYLPYAEWFRRNKRQRLIDEAGLHAEPRKLCRAEVDYLADLFKQIRGMGAQPVALFAPLCVDLQDFRSLHRGIEEHFSAIPPLPYYYDGSRLLDLYDDEQAWFDHSHLSPSGAARFAEQVAADFCNVLARQHELKAEHAFH